jgi:hypothetical protein
MHNRVVFAFLMTACLSTSVGQAQQPHLTREGPNLVPNPTVISAKGWEITGSAQFDSTVSRTADGSGSLKIWAPYPAGFLGAPLVPVEPGKTYTGSVYMKVDDWPNMTSLHCAAYDSKMNFVVNLPASRQLTTAAGVWQETSVLCTPGAGHAYLKLVFLKSDEPTPNKPAWIDEIYVGEGVGFEQAPTAKEGFDGSSTRLDSLGNFEVFDGTAWKPFFPFCICADGRRQDWSVYKKAGFNCDTWGGDASTVKTARDAGLMSGIDVSGYAETGGASYKDYALLASRIKGIVDAHLESNVLFYYFDNESYQYYDTTDPMSLWEVPKTVLETVSNTELQLNGNHRLWPRYMLSGNEGMARAYGDLVELVGVYIGSNSAGASGVPAGLAILDNAQGQRHPTFAQINPSQTAFGMRSSIYRFIIGGARGFSFWRDIVPNASDQDKYAQWGVVPIEQTDWFAELPKVRAEIDQILPILRQPHWTGWQVRGFQSNSCS